MAEAAAPTTHSRPAFEKLLEAATKALAIGTIALPAVGALIRFWSFTWAGIPQQWAAAASIPDLVIVAIVELTGITLGVVGGTVAVVVIFSVGGPLEPRAPAYATAQRSRWRYLRYLVLGTFSLFVVAIVGRGSFPGGWIAGFGALLGTYLLVRATRTWARISLVSLLPAVVVTLGTTVIGSAIAPAPARAVYLVPVEGVPISAGWYDEVGAADGALHVRACDPSRQLVSIPERSVAVRVLAPEPGLPAPVVTFLDVLTGQRLPHWGFVSGCSTVYEPPPLP